MGRLQKKKPASEKRKKNRGGENVASTAAQTVTERVESPDKEVKKRPAAAPRPATASKAEPSKPKQLVDRSLQFLREVKVELKKVTWPSRKQTVGSTLVVIVLVMIISLFLGIVDAGLSSLVRAVLG